MIRPNAREKALLRALGEIQGLSGKATGDYLNDRSPERAELILPALARIFNLCVEARSEYPFELLERLEKP